MIFFSLLYFKLAVALSIAASAGLLAWLIGRRFPQLFGSRNLLRLQWLLLVGACVGALGLSARTSTFRFEAPLKLWSAASFHASDWQQRGAGIIVPVHVPDLGFSVTFSLLVGSAVLAVLFALWACRISRLYVLVRSSIILRSVGRVRVLIADDIASPVSFWLPARAYVALPSWILERPELMKISILHELQHHRAKDTLSAHVLGLMRVLFFWNPLLRTWERVFQEFQEMLCDRNLIGRQGISEQSYSRCLLEVAAHSFERPRYLAGTPGFAWSVSRGHLKRRLKEMNNTNNTNGINRKIQHWAAAGLLIAGVGCVALASVVSNALVQDSRISMEKAKSLAAELGERTEFPIVVNERVLEQLNRYVSTPDGRAFFNGARARMDEMRPLLNAAVQSYGAPVELLAIPFVESGYKNLEANANPGQAAGVWQFLRATAVAYGLRVDTNVDERLNVEKETDAALRYIVGAKYRFNDWLLAIQSYNAGFDVVQRGIEKTGSRNAFDLIDAGYEGDENYLPKVMAVVLILNSPELTR
ncbi:MAG: M56 and MltD domain-containing protein [Bdellovibrionota bacterium]